MSSSNIAPAKKQTFSVAISTESYGFYMWKSKNENRAKYAQKFVLDFADKYGIDAAIRIAEVVLKD